MNEKIYRCLNGAQIDLDEFEEIPMTGAQRKRIEKLVKQSANRRRKVWGRAGLAAAAALAVILCWEPVRTQVVAAVKSIGMSLAQFWGVSDRLDEYEDVVNETNQLGGLQVTLKSVLMDEKYLYVSTALEGSQEEMDKLCESMSIEKGAARSGTIFAEKVGDQEQDREPQSAVQANPDVFDIRTDMNGQVLKLKGNEIEVSEQSFMQIVWCYERGEAEDIDESQVEIQTVCSWQGETCQYKFSADSRKLSNDTLKLPLNQKITFESEEVEFLYYTSSAMGERIDFLYQGEELEENLFDLYLYGKDQNGNMVWFDVESGEGNAVQMGRENGDKEGEVLTGIVTLKLIMFNADGIDSYTRDADGGFYSYEIDEETLEEKEKVSLNDRVTELGTITFDTGR